MRDYDDLTIDERAEIWKHWYGRATVKRLAKRFNTTEAVIRYIISLPRQPG